MNDEIFFDGVRYVSAGQAASFLGITRDYVARLCKEAKLAGRRVGREWYVSNDSLRSFLVDQEYTKARRREDLAETRRHEDQVNSQNGGHTAGTVAPYASVVASSAAQHRAPATVPPPAAASQTPYAHQALAHAMKKQAHNIISSEPLAAAGSLRVPVHALTPSMDILHRLVALMVAVLFTAGTYAFIDAEYARITLRDTPGIASSIVESARTQLAAVAENPPRAFGDMFARLARAVNERVNAFVYSIAFPDSLVPRYSANASGGAVSVRVSAGTPPSASTSLAGAATKPASRATARTSGTVTNQVIERVIVERVPVEASIVSSGGISEEVLNARLQQLDNKLMNLIYGVSSSPGPVTYVSTPPASGGIVNTIALTNKIDQLSDVAFSGGTITGTDISGGTLTDATISGGSLSGASVSATTLSASGATSLATTTVTGDLTVSGSLSFTGASSSLSVASASTSLLSVFTKAYFGGSATSTFDSAGNLAVAGTLGVTGAAQLPSLTASGNTTLSNATTTNLFSTTASST